MLIFLLKFLIKLFFTAKKKGRGGSKVLISQKMSFLSSFIFSPSDYSIDLFQFRSINQNSMDAQKKKKGVRFAGELRKAFQKKCRLTTVLMNEELTRYLREKRVRGQGSQTEHLSTNYR